MKPGDIVETPRGLLAKVLAVRGNRVDLRYLSNGVTAGGRTGLARHIADVCLPLHLLRPAVTKSDKPLALVARQ